MPILSPQLLHYYLDILVNFFDCLVPRRHRESEKNRGGGARGLMGRERIVKRLADLAFKMAADNLCSSESVLDRQERPVHVAFFGKKLPCPQTFYKDKRYCSTKMASIIIFVQFHKK